MARISNSLSPACVGDKIVIKANGEVYTGYSIAKAKEMMALKNRGIVTADSFEVWSVHHATTWVNGEQYDPFPESHKPKLLQKKGP